MESLEEEDDERFKKQFSTYLADGVGSEDMEEIYAAAYAAIREDPSFTPTEKSKNWAEESKQYQDKRTSYDTKKAKIAAKIQLWNDSRAGQAADSEEEEDDE